MARSLHYLVGAARVARRGQRTSLQKNLSMALSTGKLNRGQVRDALGGHGYMGLPHGGLGRGRRLKRMGGNVNRWRRDSHGRFS